MLKYLICRVSSDGTYNSRVIEAVSQEAAERTASVFFGRLKEGDITSVTVLQ